MNSFGAVFDDKKEAAFSYLISFYRERRLSRFTLIEKSNDYLMVIEHHSLNSKGSTALRSL